MDETTRRQFALAKAQFKAQLELKKEMHKGEPGYTPVKGKDYFTKREIAEIIRDVQSMIRVPVDGKDAVVDYDKILRYTYMKVAEHVAKIPTQVGLKGEKGDKGEDAVVDLDEMVRRVIVQLPKQKDKKFVIDRKQIEELIDARVKSAPQQHVRIGGSVASIRALTDVNLDGLSQDAQGNYILGGGIATSIAGLITPGSNVSFTGSGTLADPYVINVTGAGGDMLASVYDPANKAEQVLTISDATTTPTADKIVERDTNANVFANNVFTNLTSTVSAGGTTVLTVASARVQRLTGSSSQTFQLPDATTLPLSSIFEFDNNSSSSLIITNAGAATQYTVPAGGAVLCIVTSIGTANGAWQFHALTPGSVTWGSGITGLVMNSVLSTSPRIGSGASSAAAPSFIPQRGANTTGFGGDGTDLHATIAGVAILTVDANGVTAPKFTATTDNAYDATTWNGSLRLVTENAIRDKIESLASGGITRTVTSISTPTTAGASASVDYVYFVTNTTLTLPTAVGNTNRYTVKCISGTCVVDGAGAETIDGTTTITMKPEESVDLISNGINFNIN